MTHERPCGAFPAAAINFGGEVSSSAPPPEIFAFVESVRAHLGNQET
jgi:hypothetical protein